MSYLTFKANDASVASTFTPGWDTIGTGGMQYRAVGATEWTDAVKGVAITVDTTGIELKADTIKTSTENHFSMTGSISASGDITSLTNGVGGDCTLNNGCYWGMFISCNALTTAPALPATTLANNCYNYMFLSCGLLTTAPILPATTLAEYCYYGMFYNCVSLTIAPTLSATVMAKYCYSGMFYNCTALTAAPALPATTLAEHCYDSMFLSCTSLIVPPTILPATILKKFCYLGMFADCELLNSVPELPATKLADYCYEGMFQGCTSLIGYTTPEPGFTIIHNFPSSTAIDWNNDMYYGINTISTIPANPSSNVNYYFKPVVQPMSVEGKVLSCIAHSY